MHMIVNQGEAHPDILELTEDNPTIVLGSKIDSVDSEDEEVPPFYMSLMCMIWFYTMTCWILEPLTI